MSSIVIAQGGGPTAVINQTLCGAIVAARRHDPSLRILGARWLDLPPERGGSLALGTASISELGFEREQRVITRWNT